MSLASRFGGVEQKGTVMGVFRSLGALARAVGPVIASIGNFFILIIILKKVDFIYIFSLLEYWLFIDIFVGWYFINDTSIDVAIIEYLRLYITIS